MADLKDTKVSPNSKDTKVSQDSTEVKGSQISSDSTQKENLLETLENTTRILTFIQNFVMPSFFGMYGIHKLSTSPDNFGFIIGFLITICSFTVIFLTCNKY